MSLHPDLRISIPRDASKKGHRGSAKPYWDLVRKHGKSRKSMVAFICGIGGYGDRHERFAIAFNVRAYHANTSAENLWKLLTSGDMDLGPDPKLPPEHMTRAKALFWRVYAEHVEDVFSWGCEEAYEGWRDSDIPFETFTGRRVDWSFELRGRSSGNLVMTECAGIDLKCHREDLEERLMSHERSHSTGGGYEVEWAHSHANVRDLFIICVQNEIDLTTEKVGQEVEYRAAWRLWSSFCEDELKGEIAEYETRESLSHHAGEIVEALGKHGDDKDVTHLAKRVAMLATFRDICKLADVKIGE